MISWMQRHRKYLVITIWISTIAFVGAGFVGWGAYSFGKDKSSSVALVGHRNITVQEFRYAYSNYYSYYNNLLNGSLTQEKAKEMGLEKIVLQNLINQTLLLNYADDLGLKTLDSEIKARLANDKAFQQDGIFNVEQYKMVLRNVGLSPQDFEANLAQEILLNKVENLLSITPSKKTIELLGSSIFMEDKVAVQTILVQPSDVVINDELLKKFWEPIKDKFLTKRTYEVKSLYVDSSSEEVTDEELKAYYDENKHNFLDSEGKIKNFESAKDDVTQALKLSKAKKVALKSYLKAKKDEIALSDTKIIDDEDERFIALRSADNNETLKPIEYENGFLVARLVKTNEPKAMTFEEAKADVTKEYQVVQMKDILVKKSLAQLDMFQGTDIGFVSIDSDITIPTLTKSETRMFLSQLFANNDKKGYIIIGNKSVLYNILEQKLLSNNKLKEHNEELTKMAKQFENDQIQKALLEELSKRYVIEQYYKGN